MLLAQAYTCRASRPGAREPRRDVQIVFGLSTQLMRTTSWPHPLAGKLQNADLAEAKHWERSGHRPGQARREGAGGGRTLVNRNHSGQSSCFSYICK